jgi:disulfide bond formation protein DsbB
MTVGIIAGVGLPFVPEMNSQLLVVIVLIFLSASLGIYFIKETKQQESLPHLYCDIIPEHHYPSKLDCKINKKQLKAHTQSNLQNEDNNSNLFKEIMKELDSND